MLKIVLYSYGVYSEENLKAKNYKAQSKSYNRPVLLQRGKREKQAHLRVNQRPQKS